MHLPAQRAEPSGLHSGTTRSRVSPLEECIQLVQNDMVDAEAHLSKAIASTVPAVDAIGRYLSDAGGKRLRPLLTALGARAAGNTGVISRLMCAGEILHLGSLLHDDVVDGGLQRRGRPTAHRVYGNPAVILTGDVCLARAVLIAGEEAGQAATLEMARVVTAMAEGEVLQLLHAGSLDLPLATYLDIIDRKSAALISWCAAAGAWAVDAPDHAEALQAFGRAIGVAFQITDDVLDYTGSSTVMGKRAGQDLAERKLTLPLLFACEMDPTLRKRLVGAPPTPDSIPALVQAVISTGGPERALAHARARVADGVRALDSLPPGPHRQALVQLADYLVERAH
ncbi:MAG: polyprenyl synthetase family protein [Myxococcota bacterium]|nr:polyprenyl synthetase family protein [Myxococcota bacterium]MEC8424595.1 polyprenyl synthetase family protein [Myxococcota bacterium]